MSIHRYDAKRDANELGIVKVFEKYGISVERLGTPLDLLLGYNKKNYLVEVKMPKKGLNKKQTEFVATWKGQHFVCFTEVQAEMLAIGITKSKH